MNKTRGNNTSRRDFVRGITGAAFAGALSAGPCLRGAFAGNQAGKGVSGGGEKLVAPCGLYCGACPMYLATQENSPERLESLMKQFSAGKMQMKREDLLCDGCIGGGRVAAFCRRCDIRSCAESRADVAVCSDCLDVPCAKITRFNNDGMVHHSEVIENLRQLKGMGLSKWARYEEERWRCPRCSGRISWYDRACPKCGTARSGKLFPLKQT